MRTKFLCHRLKENFTSQRPTKLLYLDVETSKQEEGDRIRLPFRLAVTCYEHRDRSHKTCVPEWNHFWDQETLANYINSKIGQKEKLVIFTHNAEFDSFASGILSYLTHHQWCLQFFYANGMVFILTAKCGTRKICILSTTNFYATKLKNIGKMLGLEKKEIDLFQADDETLLDYCTRDVEIVRLAVHKWFEVLDRGNYGGFKMTKASQALAAFRHRFMTHGIYPHTEPDVKLLERRSYAGGRCENFYIGSFCDGPFVKLDFNSNYSSVMIKNAYPTKLVSVFDSIDIEHLASLLRSQLCVADVVLNTDVPVYPIKANGKLIFPIGEFKTTLCSRALEFALSHGHIRRINMCALYEGRVIFKDYIKHFYGEKLYYQLEGNEIFRTVYKYLMNTLYGKFAERRPIRTTRIDFDGLDCYRGFVIDMTDGSRGFETKILNTVFEDVGYEDTPHTFTAISSHVTEDARLLLYSVYERLGLDNVLYSDTDSIICRESELYKIPDLLDEERLGALDIEGRADDIDLWSPKSYRMGDEIKLKGVPKNATKIGDRTYKYESFMRSTSLLKEGKIGEVEIRMVEKTLNFKYTKGKVGANGKVSPFVLPFDAHLLYSSP